MTKPPAHPVPPALQKALDDYDRARQHLLHRLAEHPDHPEAETWRALLADCPPGNGDT